MKNTKMNIDRSQVIFLSELDEQRKQYMEVLENLFGCRDSRFLFGSIKRSTHKDGMPETFFPNGYSEKGGCVVDIQISPQVYFNQALDQAMWQIAHESVHLLDPCCKGAANILEEGLETWFQDEEKYHPNFVQEFIRRNCEHISNYAEAKELVVGCMPHLAKAVREIRSNGIRLQDFEPRLLKALLPDVDDSVVHRLCAPFGS